MHKLTSFVRMNATALLERAQWRLRMLKNALTVKPIRGADGEGGEGGGEGGEGGGSGTATAEPAAGAGGEPGGGEPEKKYTEDDITRIVTERLARDRRDRPSDDEIRELREKAQQLDDAEAENASDLERATTRADEAEQKAAEATTRAHEIVRRAEIIAAAAKLSAVNPGAVHALLKEQDFKLSEDGKELSVTVGDDGQVTGAEEVVKAFLETEQNKYLVGSTPGPGPGDGGARTPVPEKDLDEKIAEAESNKDWATFNRLNTIKLSQAKE